MTAWSRRFQKWRVPCRRSLKHLGMRPNCLLFSCLAVAPDLQRGGLAREMVADAERLLRNAGCPKINLQSRTSNQAVIEFYRRLGYSVDDVVSMGKRLERDDPP